MASLDDIFDMAQDGPPRRCRRRFLVPDRDFGHGWGVSPPLSTRASDDAPQAGLTFTLSPQLVEELRQAIAEIERGEHIEITHEQLEAWAETGELPWPDASHD